MTGVELSKEKTAQFFGVDTRTIDRWKNSGCPGDKTPRGHWVFNSVAVSNWLKERERESALGELANIGGSEARRRKLAAEASREELKLAIEEGKVVAIADYELEGQRVAAAIRAQALNYPVKMAPLVYRAKSMNEGKQILDYGMRELLNELSNLDGIIQEQTEVTAEPKGSKQKDRKAARAASGSNGKRVGRQGKKAESRIKPGAR